MRHDGAIDLGCVGHGRGLAARQRHWGWRAGVLEAIVLVAGEARTLGRTEGLDCPVAIACRLVVGVSSAHLLPHLVVAGLLGVVLVEVDHVHGSLGVLLLLLLGNAILLEHALPFLGKALDGVSNSRRQGGGRDCSRDVR